MKKRLLMIAMILIVAAASLSAVTIADGEKILEQVDNNSNFEGTDFSALMSMISEDPEDGIDKTTVQQFRDDDGDKFLMLIQEPLAQKGQGYLMIEDNLWFYDPESRKFSHTSMKEQFNDTDANNSDFSESSTADDYDVVSIEEGKLGKYEVYVIVIEANNDEVTYPTQKLWVTRNGSLVLKTEDYSAGDRLMRTSYYPSYAKAGDNYIPTKMIFVDELIEGKKTTITLSEISVKDVPDTLFTKSYVERVNQ